MDLELKKLIGTEITEEFLTENKIETIEQYREFVKNDNNQDTKNNKANSKKAKKQAEISATKQKQMKRRNESLLNKKIKNQQREKIMQSLQQHNNQEERNLVELLESSKNLGKKRKNSNSLKPLKSENNEDLVEDEKQSENENELASVSSSEFSDSDLDVDTRKNKLNLSLNEMHDAAAQKNKEAKSASDSKNLHTKKNLMDISPEETSKIMSEITQYRLREAELERLAELQNSSTYADESEFNEDSIISNLAIPAKTHIKLIQREALIQAERLNLPIVKYEQEIMDKINHNLCTVVCGETGSGKSTQIPQFLYEYGYTGAFGAIAITQPRRVAAISLASRVATEMNCKLADEVGYQIRYDSQHFSDKTVIKYLTDGILLKEIESDAFLLKYSVVIIDEAHERTINTDIIIGLLSQAVRLRYLMSKNRINIGGKEVSPLRIVIMSATMRVDEFLESYVFNPKPAFIKVEARRFPVTVHHLKRTEANYLDQAFKMTCKIHRKLPPGGILIFLTGKQEILTLCEKLSKEFEENPEQDNKNENEEAKEKLEENKIEAQNASGKMRLEVNLIDNKFSNNNNDNNKENTSEQVEENKLNENNEPRVEDLIMNDDEGEQKMNVNNEVNSEDELNDEDNIEDNKIRHTYKKAMVLPLFSSLTKEQQMSIFQKLDPNTRLIVVSTNIAETSLTIPNVRYVVDSGKAKKRVFKAGLSFSSFKVEWISQASAEQRTGRAGRTCAGFCYRLYSNGLFSKMERFTEPQIVSSPLDQTILYLKEII